MQEIFLSAKLHAMYQIANAPLRQFPCPHIYVEDVFPAEFYAELQRNMVPDDGYQRLVDTGRVGGGYSPARLALFHDQLENPAIAPAAQDFWMSLFKAFVDREFAGLWLQIFGDAIRAHVSETRAANGAEQLPMGAEMFLMRDLTSYSLGPHTDSPAKVVSVLFYLPPEGTSPSLGTSLYLPKDRAFLCAGGPHHSFDRFDRVITLPYRPNALLAFPKTRRSFHGVEPVTGDQRRDLLLYDIKLRG